MRTKTNKIHFFEQNFETGLINSHSRSRKKKFPEMFFLS